MSRTFLITGLSVLLILCSTGVSMAQDEESFVRESIISKRDAVVLSVLFPGLGQMTAGQKVKGVSLFLAEAASLVLFVNAHEDYSTKVTTYDKDIAELDKIATIGGNRGRYSNAQEMFKDLQDQKNKLDDLNTIRNTAIIVAAGVYAFNIVDAIFFSSSTSESRRAEKTDKTRVNVSSTIIDRTPGIMLTKRF
ncbi:DUF5683 domain-containing protein [Candidatus Omnitrophota bacterium]